MNIFFRILKTKKEVICLKKTIFILTIAFIALSGCIGPVAVCGNGICEASETAENCPADCGPTDTVYLSNCQPISKGGTYLLTQPVSSTTGPCFSIYASNVLLDCQGNAITGGGRGNGIHVRQQIKNVTVQNCKVSDFVIGIEVDILDSGIFLSNNKACNNSLYDIRCESPTSGTKTNTADKVNNCSSEIIGNKCSGYCGDGQCTYPEDKYNCPADCGPPICITEGNTGTSGEDECCEGLSQIDDCYGSGQACSCAIDRFVCTYCGNGECGLGENQCNCPEDCRPDGAKYCNEMGGQILYNDYFYTEIDKRNFWKSTSAVFYSCDGDVVDAADGNCCIGELRSYWNSTGSLSEVKVNDPFLINFYIRDQNPIVRVEYDDGTSETIDCNVQAPYGDCQFSTTKRFFSTPGTKKATFFFETGPIAEKSIDVTVDVLSESDFTNLCEQRQNEPIEAEMISKGSKLPSSKRFLSSGRLATISFGEEGYIIDPAVAAEYLKMNPNASFEELQQATVENTYIVELQQEPALQIYYDNFASALESALQKYGFDSPAFRQLKKEAESFVKNYATEIEKTQQTVISQAEALGAEVKSRYKYSFNGFLIEIPQGKTVAVLSSLQRNSKVKKIYPNMRVEATLNESVPLINADKVWAAFGAKGEGVKVGIIDTGVDYTHPDLGGCLGTGCKVEGGYDFVNYDNDPIDDMGHGTHVAGIVASDGELKGVAPKASIYAIKVLDAGGSGYWDWVIAGIEWAIDPNGDKDISDHLDVINLSLGGPGDPDDPVSKAIDRAANAGIVPVVSAGNSGPSAQTIGSPGTARKALTVGASYKGGGIAGFSSKGPVIFNNEVLLKPEVSAPGVDICSSQYDSAWNDRKCFDDKHVSISGTSMAAPHVAGVAALLKQAHPEWNNEQIKSAIVNNAREMPKETVFAQGSGVVDALASANAVLLMQPAVANLGFFSDHNEAVIEVKNVSGMAQGISAAETVNFDRIDIDEIFDSNVQLRTIISKNCLQPGETATLSISIASPNPAYGIYAGNMPVLFHPNCGIEATGSQNIPVSFAKVKVVQIDLNIDPLPGDDSKIFYEYLIIVRDLDGRFIDATQFYGKLEDVPAEPQSLLIPSDENRFVLLFESEYEQKFTDMRFRFGAKEIVVESNALTVEIDEHAVDEIENSVPSYLESKGLQDAVLTVIFSTKIGEMTSKLGWGYSESSTACRVWHEQYKVYRLLGFDRESDFHLMVQAVPTGFSFYNTPQYHFIVSEASYPSGNLRFEVNANSIKETELVVNDSISLTNQILQGFAEYHKTDNIIGTSVVPTIPGKKQVFYTSNPEFGFWMPIDYDTVETVPELARDNWLPFFSYSMNLFNGKTRNEFDSWYWTDIPTGDMPNPIEFMKEPIKFDALIQYNNYLQPTLRNAYRNNQFYFGIWDRYSMEQVAEKNKGKITVTTPSGSIVSGKGIYFILNCFEDSKWNWPKIYPCEEGEYKIHVDTEDLFRGGRYIADYNAIWGGNYWDFSITPI